MTGEAHWLPIVWMLIGGAAVLALTAASHLALRHLKAEDRHFVCPVQHCLVEATIVTDERTGQVTGVSRCTGLRNPDDVHCAKSCVIAS